MFVSEKLVYSVVIGVVILVVVIISMVTDPVLMLAKYVSCYIHPCHRETIAAKPVLQVNHK